MIIPTRSVNVPSDFTGMDSRVFPTVILRLPGVSLIHIPVFTADAYNSTPGRDLRAAGYTQVTFYARASLSTFTSVTIEAGGPNPEACMTLSTDGSVDNCGTLFPSEEHLTGVISTAWKAYTMPISKVQQSAIKDIFKATFVFANPTPGSTNPGQGGTLYLDQIFYKP